MTNDNHQSEVPLVIGPDPIAMGDRGAPPRPDRALLFSGKDGQVEELTRRPGRLASVKYSYRYEVDLSDHSVEWSEALPSGTGGFPFQAALEARWSVKDAAEVVRRGVNSVADGDSVVKISMRDVLWPITGRYGIEQLDAATSYVRTTVCPIQHPLPVGITVTALTIRLYLDERANQQLRQIKEQQFSKELLDAGQIPALTRIRYEEQLQSEREKAILAAAHGEGGLLLRLIGQDPSKLDEIMLQLGNRHDVAVEQKAQMLRSLIDADMIQPAEAQIMWQEMQRPLPLFGAGPGALAGQPEPQQLQQGSPAGPTTAPSAGGTIPGQTVPQQPGAAAPGVPFAATPYDAPPKPRRRGEPAHQATPAAANPSAPSVPPQDGNAQSAPAPGGGAHGSGNVSGTTPVGRKRSGGSDGGRK